MQVHADTYKFTHTDEYGIDRYTVEVTIKGDRREVRAFKSTDGMSRESIRIYGLAVRFKTGAKVWPGHATYWFDGNHVNMLRPDIDKWGTVMLVGFFEDFTESKHRSMHNAVA